jgi:flagellar protein FlgJ
MAISAPSSQFASALNLAASQVKSTAAPAATSNQAKARATAEGFEATFLNSMFEHMMTGIDGDGPFGGSTGIGVWRSFMTDEFSKSIAKKGGLGIADQVYRSLLSIQESSSKIPH